MKRIIGFLLWVWQLPQIIVGLFVLSYYVLRYGEPYLNRHSVSGYSDVLEFYFTVDGFVAGVSFGVVVFTFAPKRYPYKEVLRHELGHSRQSLWLGWLYLVVVGLPSLLVGSVNPRLAKWCWFERWLMGD